MLGALGGLVQINPIWLYGPFRPEAVSSPAQPDWYLGWLEGALRIFPSWEIRAFGHSIPNVFYPAVVLPGVTFALLYAWPFLERRFSSDRAEHHVLDRPREHPVRTAIGATAFTFYTLLLIAGSNDIVAKIFVVPVNGVTWVMRIIVVVLPVLVGLGFWVWLRALRLSQAESVLHVPLGAFPRAVSPSTDGAYVPARREPPAPDPSAARRPRGWVLLAPAPPDGGVEDGENVPEAVPPEPPRGWAVGDTLGASTESGEEPST